ncbi:branched-chain amino acid aminotransferase [Galdieria sulphuraria]|uniref:Branched-chain-amino-acid aminotransferase n=1 Tax=Galdieria sulphuraria TaxID=130081 RepID=M2X5X3_GALSU|nr:branched-chain amino acid aminotransferase [Galdieria sulphuraria]EME31870.1 branched-chain amino acid aminotransferase [Galdieria sulphuraria]|eukprot:XP_005708390.1 branched-chain amino acid aminotransferase [Galdieria sulphuraria]
MKQFQIVRSLIRQCCSRPCFSGLGWSRDFTTLEQAAVEQSLGPDPSRLETKLSTSPGPSDKIKSGEVRWGTLFTNHMFEAEWHLEEGWSVPRVVPRHSIELDPAASVLHYGLEVFEGLKAHRGTKDGKIRLFRPDKNIRRMAVSCARLGLATFDQQMMLECLRRYVMIERDWVPHGRGTALYLRPTCIAIDPKLGVARSKRNLFYIIASPVGHYFQGGNCGVNLLATTKYFRSFPGGIGFCKTGANYALGIVPSEEASRLGCHQVLWLSDAKNRFVTEAGVMNFFVLFKGSKRPELVTAPLDGTILDGVVRSSILDLVRSWGTIDVSERKYSIDEVVQGIVNGQVIEAFGSGTASIITPVTGIHYQDKMYPINSETNKKITPQLLKSMQDIFYGEVDDTFSWNVQVDTE